MRTTALVIILTILSGGMSDVLAAQSQTPVEATAGNGGINIAKALGIAVATGAGVVLTLVVIAMQLD